MSGEDRIMADTERKTEGIGAHRACWIALVWRSLAYAAVAGSKRERRVVTYLAFLTLVRPRARLHSRSRALELRNIIRRVAVLVNRS